MHKPYKGIVPASPTRTLKTRQPHLLLELPLKRLLLCLVVLATRKRVYVLLQRKLFHHAVFAQLIADVLLNRFLIATNCIDIVSATPKMAAPVFVFQIRVPVENHQRAFALQVTHELRHADVWRDTQKHVDMIRTCFGFENLHVLLFTQLTEYPPNIALQLPIYRLSTIFRCKYDMVLAIPITV